MRTSVKHPTTRKLAAWGMKHVGDDIALAIAVFFLVWHLTYGLCTWTNPLTVLSRLTLVQHVATLGEAGVRFTPRIALHIGVRGIISLVLAVCTMVYMARAYAALQSAEAQALLDEKRERNKKLLRDANLVAGTKVREGFRFATQLASERAKTKVVDQTKSGEPKTFAAPDPNTRVPSMPTTSEIRAVIAQQERDKRTSIPTAANDATRQLQRWLTEAGCKWATQVTVQKVTESHGDKYMYVTLTGKFNDQYLTSRQLGDFAPAIAYHMERPTEDVAVAENGAPNQAKIRVKAAVAASVIQPGPWPNGHQHSILEPVRWGRDNIGQEVLLPLFEAGRGSRMGAIGGSKGAGKSGALHPIIAHCVLAPDCEVWGIDMKGGVEFGMWSTVMDRLAKNRDQCETLLDDLLTEIHRRLAHMEGKQRVWYPAPETPAIQLFVDEMAQISTKKRQIDKSTYDEHSPMDKLTMVAQLGRAAGVGVVGATQRLSATQISTDLRSQLDDYMLALRCRSMVESEMVLAHRDVDASRISENAPGTAYIDGVARRTILARSYWLDDPTIAEIVAAHPRGVDTQPTQPQKPQIEPQIQGGGCGTPEPLVVALGPGRQRMLDLIRENPGLSGRKYAQLAGISENAARKSLQWLRDNGYVTRDWHPVD